MTSDFVTTVEGGKPVSGTVTNTDFPAFARALEEKPATLSALGGTGLRGGSAMSVSAASVYPVGIVGAATAGSCAMGVGTPDMPRQRQIESAPAGKHARQNDVPGRPPRGVPL